jgi:hypothetical protein
MPFSRILFPVMWSMKMLWRMSFLPLALMGWDIYQVGLANSVASEATLTLLERAANASDGIPGYLKGGVGLLRVREGVTTAINSTSYSDDGTYADNGTYADDTYADDTYADRFVAQGPACYPAVSYARIHPDVGLVHVGCIGPAPFRPGKLSGDP